MQDLKIYARCAGVVLHARGSSKIYLRYAGFRFVRERLEGLRSVRGFGSARQALVPLEYQDAS